MDLVSVFQNFMMMVKNQFVSNAIILAFNVMVQIIIIAQFALRF